MTTPAGWRTVPEVPTPEMLSALAVAFAKAEFAPSRDAYRAMLAAAPSPPSAEPLQDDDTAKNELLHGMILQAYKEHSDSFGNLKHDDKCQVCRYLNCEPAQQPSPPPSDALREARSVLAEADAARAEGFGPASSKIESALRTLLAAPSSADTIRDPDTGRMTAHVPPLSVTASKAALFPSVGSAGQAVDRPAAMSISKRDAWAESLKKGAHRCRQHGDNGDAETLDDVRNYLVANACGQPVDQQARRHAPTILAWMKNRGVEGADDLLALDWLRSLAHPETPNKE